jgi:hypothetical protein
MYQATFWDNTPQWGVVQCFFPIKIGVQIQMYGIIPFVWLLDLERVGTILEEFHLVRNPNASLRIEAGQKH